MKFTAKRLFGAGIMAIAAIAAPISVAALTGGPGTIASAAGASCTAISAANDTVCYVQSPNGVPDTYQYLQAGTTTPSPQTVTVSGTCATVAGASPYLNMCGFSYGSTSYPGDPNQPLSAAPCLKVNPAPDCANAANLGTNGTATGVGAVSPAWTIENKTSGSKSQAEAIDFTTGSGVTNSPPFSDAQIQVQRKDTGVAQNPFLVVELAELDGSRNVLATQDCKLTGNTGTQITVDTDGMGIGPNGSTGTCGAALGSVPSTFQTVEVRDLTNSTSISVVNTSTFTLQKQVCPGSTIYSNNSPPNEAIAALTLSSTANACKAYSAFTATTTGSDTNVEFDASATGGDLYWTIQFNWPEQPFCTPNGEPPGPACTPDTVSFSDPSTNTTVTNQDQTYCASATAADQLCTVSKNYNYNVPQINGGPGVQITETWSGFLDWSVFH